jgi:hypothetical protein
MRVTAGPHSRLRRTSFFLLGILVYSNAAVSAQEEPEQPQPEIMPNALVLNVTARVLQEGGEIWNTNNSKVTIPGEPMRIKLEGSNIMAMVSFTPYQVSENNYFLVAQGQIWVLVPGQGIHYKTTLETIPVNIGELIYFFPLGHEESESDENLIELEVALSQAAPLQAAPSQADSQPELPADTASQPDTFGTDESTAQPAPPAEIPTPQAAPAQQ